MTKVKPVYRCFSGPQWKPSKCSDRMLVQARAFDWVQMSDGKHRVVQIHENKDAVQIEIEFDTLRETDALRAENIHTQMEDEMDWFEEERSK